MKWSEKFCVSAHDVDFTDTARLSSVLRYMQEAANRQLHNIGPSNEELRSKYGRTFIVSRIGVAIYIPLHSYDEIVAQSWACESRLTSFVRCGRIFLGDENGPVAAELTSVWALVDINDHHLCRIEDAHGNYGTDEPISPPSLPSRLRLPKDLVFEEAGKRRIVYSDADINMHMNNTVYPDMLMDYSGGLTSGDVDAFSINYISEAAIGDEITVFSCKKDKELYFKTLKSDGNVGIEALFKLK